MSDRKHIEYCIKLGNTLLQNKLDSSNQYVENIETQAKYNEISNNEEMSFRARLQNWK